MDVQRRVRSIVPLEKVTLIFNGESVEEIPLSGRSQSADFRKTQLKVITKRLVSTCVPKARLPTASRWIPRFAQGFTNPVWVIVGNQPVRDRASAEYCIKWIDKLQTLADAWPGWRSQKEKDHVFAQFDEARAVYRQRLAEAAPLDGRRVVTAWPACRSSPWP